MLEDPGSSGHAVVAALADTLARAQNDPMSRHASTLARPAGIRMDNPVVLCAGVLWGLLVGCAGPVPEQPEPEPTPQPAAQRVQTTSGPVIGAPRVGVMSFMGVPYAAPPVGALRFAPPAAPTPWTDDLFLDDEPPTRCPQEVPFLGRSTDEDCLYLNVHVPDPITTGAPVMVWIHGGGFTLGEGVQVDEGTDGGRFAAAEGVITVSINYRLGQLGFLAHPALDAEQGSSGNYGLLDQVAALEWVSNNIEAFGGDPERVTIAGQSAGGMSVCTHLVSPLTEGLFSAAIVMSGPCDLALPESSAQEQGLRLAEALDCEDVDCLRAASVDAILDVLPGSQDFVTSSEGEGLWGPTVDGHVMPVSYAEAIPAGDAHPVPVLTGFTANEGRVFAALTDGELGAEDYEDALRSFATDWEADPDAVVAAYPLNGEDPQVRYFDALGDRFITCAARRAALALARHQPTWLYYFRYPDAPFQVPQSFDMGAYHAGELQYVFGHPAALTRTEHEGADLQLHESMRTAFGAFVRTGEPTVAGQSWSPAEGVARYLVFDRTIRMEDDVVADRCAAWPGP